MNRYVTGFNHHKKRRDFRPPFTLVKANLKEATLEGANLVKANLEVAFFDHRI